MKQHIEFDLKNYNLKAGSVIPIFEVKKSGTKYKIYCGKGENFSFEYWEVKANTMAGKLCSEWLEQRNQINTIDQNELIELCKREAYLKYWNDCHTDKEKMSCGFYGLMHVDALKKWYKLGLDYERERISNLYEKNILKEVHIEKWKIETLESVAKYLRRSEINDLQPCSLITADHATELIKFHEWLEKKVKKNYGCYKTKSGTR